MVEKSMTRCCWKCWLCQGPRAPVLPCFSHLLFVEYLNQKRPGNCLNVCWLVNPRCVFWFACCFESSVSHDRHDSRRVSFQKLPGMQDGAQAMVNHCDFKLWCALRTVSGSHAVQLKHCKSPWMKNETHWNYVKLRSFMKPRNLKSLSKPLWWL